MWICASCGTEAQQPETCSGCGATMKPFDSPPRPCVQFMLAVGGWDGYDQYIGPFPTVMEAEQWWDQHKKEDRFKSVSSYEAILLEAPENAEATT